MLRLLADQNFNHRILRGLEGAGPDLSVVTAQECGLDEAEDPTLLAYAAAFSLIVLSHDRDTMPGFAYARVQSNLGMPGLFVVDDQMPIGRAIEELQIVCGCSSQAEWANRVQFFPMR